MHALLNIAVSAARKAGDIILRYMEQTDRIAKNPKGVRDFFTEVDVKAEQAIIHTILKAYPDHGILAEESGIHHPKASTIWIIDPLDGTTNYLHQFPMWCVSIAVCIKNRVEHAVIFDPLRQEFFTATRGSGAQLNDRRLRVSKQREMSASLIGAAFSPHRTHDVGHAFKIFEQMSSKVHGVRRTGSAALELAYVAAGRLDGFWGFGLKPWDIAAAALLVQEAGGLVSAPTGQDNWLDEGNIVAGTPKIFTSLLSEFSLHPKTLAT